MDIKDKLDINAVCFGILCNFPPVCGEEKAKEAVALIRSLQAENEKLRTGLNKAPECERCQEIKGERQMYINACEQIKSLQALLQKRNEILQHKDNEIKQLRDELKQVKQERDEAIKTIFKWTGCPECGFENIGRGNFCQNCGCLYTDDAVEIVMKRLEDIYALHND